MAKLTKLAKMAGVIHEADHGLLYPEHLVIASISYRCINHGLCFQFAMYFYPLLGIVEFLALFYDLDCQYFRILTICLLLVYIVCAAGLACWLISLLARYLGLLARPC